MKLCVCVLVDRAHKKESVLILSQHRSVFVLFLSVWPHCHTGVWLRQATVEQLHLCPHFFKNLHKCVHTNAHGFRVKRPLLSSQLSLGPSTSHLGWGGAMEG